MMRDPKRASTAKLPRIEDVVKAGGFLCGNANDLIEHIKALEKRYPALDRISVSLSVGVPEKVALEQLDQFAKEVIPHSKEPRRGWDLCRLLTREYRDNQVRHSNSSASPVVAANAPTGQRTH